MSSSSSNSSYSYSFIATAAAVTMLAVGVTFGLVWGGSTSEVSDSNDVYVERYGVHELFRRAACCGDCHI
jgi:hypothetical protein